MQFLCSSYAAVFELLGPRVRGSKGKLLFKFHSSRNSGGKEGEEGGKELSSLSSASLGQSAEVLERLQNPRSPPGGGREPCLPQGS